MYNILYYINIGIYVLYDNHKSIYAKKMYTQKVWIGTIESEIQKLWNKSRSVFYFLNSENILNFCSIHSIKDDFNISFGSIFPI